MTELEKDVKRHMKQKILKTLIFKRLGFPIRLRNVPMIYLREEWIPHIDYNSLQKAVLLHLCHKKSPFTGAEIAFIRNYFAMSTVQFGQKFGCSHVAVLKWEKYREKFARISPPTEVCIRLFILLKLKKKASAFKELYIEIDIPSLNNSLKRSENPDVISIDAQEESLSAA